MSGANTALVQSGNPKWFILGPMKRCSICGKIDSRAKQHIDRKHGRLSMEQKVQAIRTMKINRVSFESAHSGA